MRKTILIYLAAGSLIAAGSVALAWWAGGTNLVSGVRWQVAALMLLGAELAFLLFVPANKGGQQFGPHGGPASAPFVSSGADFYDDQPSRRLGDWRWLLIGLPILIAFVIMLIALAL